MPHPLFKNRPNTYGTPCMSELWTSKDSKIISRKRSNFWLSLEYKSGFNYFSDFQMRSKYLKITVYSWMNNILLFRVILSKSVADFTSCMAKSLFQDAFSLHVLQIFACGWARAFDVDILSKGLSFIFYCCDITLRGQTIITWTIRVSKKSKLGHVI